MRGSLTTTFDVNIIISSMWCAH